MKRFLTSLPFILFVALFLTSTVGASEKTMVFALGASPTRLDPPNATNNPGEIIVRHICENLVDFGDNMEVVPSLAESVITAEDGMEYTFKLRKGVTFHDGTPFNGDAVVANVERLLDKKNRKTRRTKLYKPFIQSVSKVDDYTVKLHMKQPFGGILSHFAHSAGGMVSPKTLAKFKEMPLNEYIDFMNRNPVGTGPYKLSEWVPGSHLLLERFDGYRKGKAKIEKVKVQIVKESASRVIMLETGEADVAYPVPMADVERLKKGSNTKVYQTPTTRVMFVGMNHTKKPFDDIRVRLAINHAIDKEAIIKYILKGNGRRSDSMMASLVWAYKKTGNYDHNPEKARQLLKEAGFPNGFSTTFVTPDGRYPMDSKVSEAVVGMLRKVGINSTLRKMEWSAYLTLTSKPPSEATYEMYFMGWSPSTGDADWGLRPLFTKAMWKPAGSNRLVYTHPEVERLIAEGMVTFTPEDRRQIYADVQQVLYDTAPWAMMYDMVATVGVKKNLKGVKVWPIEIVTLGDAYFE